MQSMAQTLSISNVDFVALLHNGSVGETLTSVNLATRGNVRETMLANILKLSSLSVLGLKLALLRLSTLIMEMNTPLAVQYVIMQLLMLKNSEFYFTSLSYF